MPTSRNLLAVFGLLLFAPLGYGEENWTEYRGPQGTGVSDSKGVPIKWSEKENVRWKVAIHDKGWSSPVILGNQIWLTTATADGKSLYAICIERDSGKIVHDIKVFDVPKPQYADNFNSYASPTPVIEEGRVYVHFGAPGTACIDTKTGKVLWERKDFVCNHHRGAGSSPILFENLVILTFDGFDYQYLAALNKATGETVWKQDRKFHVEGGNGDHKKAYSTPAVFKVGDQYQLVSASSDASAAYDPKTGKEIWRVRHGGMNASARPVYAHGLMYVTSSDGGKQLVAIRPDGKDDVTKTHIDWTYGKGVPNRASLMLLGDRMYMVNSGGILSVIDAKTGKDIEKGRLNGGFTASPVSADGKIYFFNMEGQGYVVAADKELTVLNTNKLDAGCMASPAIAGKALYVRTKTHLYRIEAPEK